MGDDLAWDNGAEIGCVANSLTRDNLNEAMILSEARDAPMSGHLQEQQMENYVVFWTRSLVFSDKTVWDDAWQTALLPTLKSYPTTTLYFLLYSDSGQVHNCTIVLRSTTPHAHAQYNYKKLYKYKKQVDVPDSRGRAGQAVLGRPVCTVQARLYWAGKAVLCRPGCTGQARLYCAG